MKKPIEPLDPHGIRTYSLAERQSKVSMEQFARPWQRGGSLRNFLDGLPDVLAARDLKDAAAAIVKARQEDRPVIAGFGAHVIKVGLSPLVVEAMRAGIVTGVAMNGAGAVHDFELALAGRTSEDVAASLADGSFGMSGDTARALNSAVLRCAAEEIGLGAAAGQAILKAGYKYAEHSILAQASSLSVPATVHVAIGTDIVHMHPEADGAAIGRGSLYDFRLFAALVAGLHHGVYLNIGSAVILPEVFLKAVSLARNKGHIVKEFTTVNMDFIRQYRPETNVVDRPVRSAGRGISLIGHHEIMLPLLFAAVVEAWPGRPKEGV